MDPGGRIVAAWGDAARPVFPRSAVQPGPGLGIALKIDDGAGRAAECALAALLLRYGQLDRATRAMLTREARRALTNWAGTRVGHCRPVEGWPG